MNISIKTCYNKHQLNYCILLISLGCVPQDSQLTQTGLMGYKSMVECVLCHSRKQNITAVVLPVVSYLRAFGSTLPSPVETRPSLRENHLNTENHING